MSPTKPEIKGHYPGSMYGDVRSSGGGAGVGKNRQRAKEWSEAEWEVVRLKEVIEVLKLTRVACH